MVLKKTLASPLDCKEIQPVHPKGDQFWVFIGRIDVEAETPILWPPDVKNWLFWKHPDAGKDWRWEEKGTTEDNMVGWHHQLNAYDISSENWWWTGRPGMLQSMGSQRVGQDWVTELNWTPKGTLRASIVLTSHVIEAGKTSEPFGPKPPHYNRGLQNLDSWQNLHSQFMTEAGKRPGVLNLIAPLAPFFPEIGFPYVKNKSSSISTDFIYKLISGNTTQKVHACTWWKFSSVQSLSRVRLCTPMNRSTPGLPVHHQLSEFTQTHVHRISDAIQPSHPLSSPPAPAPNTSQHQGLFQWVSSLHQVAKVLEILL